MAAEDREKRRHDRYPFSRAIEYVPVPDKKVLKGFAVNISEAGLCFASSYSFEKGQQIGIRTKLPVLHQEGVIVWSYKIDETLYKAGVKFV
jgi:hypothetical protein